MLLLQNFMAAAPAPASMDQGYSSYQTHGGPMYGSPAANSGPAAHAGGYGSTYGANYGY